MKRVIEKLRKLIRKQRYMISTHANEEMSEDRLIALDIEQGILTGRITKRFTKDARGTRFEVTGKALNGRTIGIVCRILPSDWLRIITAYRIDSNNHEKRKM